jgi:ubiquinone/menaquinone biosynthesis C-methylase UbiE|tara:strand:- start:18 stop:620 length:603 start_codon:yes stop_codon:yes gene_type:complete
VLEYIVVDDQTIEVYNAKVDEYSKIGGFTTNQHLKDFVEFHNKNDKVLDLGCGHGSAASYMLNAGLNCHAIDASAKMVELANQKFNIKAKVCTFDELDGAESFNGIYASFSLLHVGQIQFLKILQVIKRMLLPDGKLGLGMKLGTGNKRDSIGRFYAYYTEDELTKHLEGIGLTVVRRYSGTSKGLAGDVEPWVFLIGKS